MRNRQTQMCLPILAEGQNVELRLSDGERPLFSEFVKGLVRFEDTADRGIFAEDGQLVSGLKHRVRPDGLWLLTLRLHQHDENVVIAAEA